MKGEQILAGAIRASADRYYTVPGHPVTGIAKLLSAELVVNEKVGLEYALGDSLEGRRAAVVVKTCPVVVPSHMSGAPAARARALTSPPIPGRFRAATLAASVV